MYTDMNCRSDCTLANFGFFGFGNFSRPGPGVSKDEPKKPAYIRYFQLMGRKFGKLIQLNLLFLIPFLIIVFVMGCLYFFAPVRPALQIPITENILLRLNLWDMYVVPVPLILLSPFTAGLTYVTRNFAREEHAFVFSDYKDAIKNNWKPFLLNGIFLYLAYVVITFAISYYYNETIVSWFYLLPFAVCFLVTVLLMFCQYYVPLMIITFDLPLRKIYRNALIFSIAGLWRNLLITVIFAFVLFLMLSAFASVLFLIVICLFLALFVFSFISYTANFIVYPLVEKLMIKPFYEKQNESKTDGEEAKKLEEDEQNLEESEKDKKPEYVYVNGRLMKRADLEEEQVFEDKQ